MSPADDLDIRQDHCRQSAVGWPASVGVLLLNAVVVSHTYGGLGPGVCTQPGSLRAGAEWTCPSNGGRRAKDSLRQPVLSSLDLARRDVIVRALTAAQGNRAAAARALGIHKTHLLQLMKSLRIA